MSKVDILAKQVRYESIPGLFIQSSGSAAPQAHPPAFGLKAHTSPTYWSDFETHIKGLQQSAPEDNVGVEKHGLAKWTSVFSKQNGDGEITWGPDAKLTPLGETQAREVNALWKKELSRSGDPVPLPTKLFSSPLARALATLDLTFKDVLPEDINTGDPARKPLVVENLREALAPFTSDHRSNKYEIQKTYPTFHFEESFTEQDELWSESVSESDEEFRSRMKGTLDHIFKDLLEETDTFISITAHSGVAAMILEIIGHRDYPLPSGGVVPIIIKAIL